MTYCLGIMTHQGLVMASDSRANAGYDDVNVCPKMHPFVIPGERAFVILTSGNLSLTQSVVTLLRDDFAAGEGLAKAETMYAAARAVGDAVRRVSDLDRAALEKDDFKFNIHLLLGGQIKGEKPNLYLIYPQGNPLAATQDSPYLQIGEVKYGRPILDRGIEYESTTLEVAGTYALLSRSVRRWKFFCIRMTACNSIVIDGSRRTILNWMACMLDGSKRFGGRWKNCPMSDSTLALQNDSKPCKKPRD
jgi:putative proteasome-type protease